MLTTTDLLTKTSTYKNYIINGNMSIWQRITSEQYSSGEGFTADRFSSTNYNAGGQFTIDKSGIGNSSAMRLTVDSSSTDITGTNFWRMLNHKIEAQNCYHLNGKFITISFLIRTNFTGTLSLALKKADSTRSYVTSFTVDANVTKRIVKNIQLESNTIPVNDTSTGLLLVIAADNDGAYVTSQTDQWLNGNYICSSNISHYSKTDNRQIEIAELQLERGLSYTGFEYRDITTELALCQRYFYKTYNLEINIGAATDNGRIELEDVNIGNTANNPHVVFPVTMRTTPTLTFYNPKTGAINGVYDLGDGSNRIVNSYIAGANGLAKFETTTAFTKISGSFCAATFHLTADAEL